LLNFTIL